MGKSVEIRTVSQRYSTQMHIGKVLMDMIHRGDKNIITEKSIGDYKIRVCARCYSVVYPTETPDYSFYCPEHDEDL